MKSKLLVLCGMLVVALVLMAQSATQSTPAASGDTKTCACCNHQADGKMACCGKDANCCGAGSKCCEGGDCCQGKDGKSCSMMSKDSSGKMSCCEGGKCSMASKKTGKSCCDGNKCTRPKAAA